jgi:hypothetical protein
VSQFTMPAMSPTMSEGGIAQWKLKEGDKFSQGDVLLEIVSWFTSAIRLTANRSRILQETDKATIDVEAQEDGVLGKIIVRFSPRTLAAPCLTIPLRHLTAAKAFRLAN